MFDDQYCLLKHNFFFTLISFQCHQLTRHTCAIFVSYMCRKSLFNHTWSSTITFDGYSYANRFFNPCLSVGLNTVETSGNCPAGGFHRAVLYNKSTYLCSLDIHSIFIHVGGLWNHIVCSFVSLTHLLLDEMAAILQTTFSSAFLWMKSFVFWLKFHWSWFSGV